LYLVGTECIRGTSTLPDHLIKPLDRVHMRDLGLLHTQLPFEAAGIV